MRIIAKASLGQPNNLSYLIFNHLKIKNCFLVVQPNSFVFAYFRRPNGPIQPSIIQHSLLQP